MNTRNTKGSDIDKLKLEFGNAFNQLKVTDSPMGIRISVPNDSVYVDVGYSNGRYEVKSSTGFYSTYTDLDDAKDEILVDLVTRELYDNRFDEKLIKYVNKILENG